MTEAQKILSLIESVSPDDTAALDEIDKHVYWYLSGRFPAENNDEFITVSVEIDGKKIELEYIDPPKYTRSRDALKAIRPDGWYTQANHWSWTGNEGFQGKAMRFVDQWEERDDDFITNQLPTEELAELHAIIQAIDYERNRG